MAKTILVVDDERSIVNILQVQLEHEGYKVMTAYDGTEALKKVQERKPDLIILDVMMPGLSGYQVCEKIKSAPATAEIPVIMLTAKNMGEDFERALEHKADWYVCKPYDDKYLLKKIKDLTVKI